MLIMAPAVAALADGRIGRSGRLAGTQGGYGLEVFSSEGSYCVGPAPNIVGRPWPVWERPQGLGNREVIERGCGCLVSVPLAASWRPLPLGCSQTVRVLCVCDVPVRGRLLWPVREPPCGWDRGVPPVAVLAPGVLSNGPSTGAWVCRLVGVIKHGCE